MPHRITALLVHHNSEIFISLKAALEHQDLRVAQAESTAQAKRALGVQQPAMLVFTDTQVPDGTWADILALAGKAALPVNVIVVARTVNTRLYIETIEAGAYDFIVQPFDATDLAHVVRSAADNAFMRRNVRPPSDQAA